MQEIYSVLQVCSFILLAVENTNRNQAMLRSYINQIILQVINMATIVEREDAL